MSVLYKGIEWRRRITVVDAAGAAVDLTGKAIKLQLRRRTTEAALIERTVGSGITLLTQSGATLGQADAVIAANLTTGLEVAGHVYNVLIDDQVALGPTKLAVRSL